MREELAKRLFADWEGSPFGHGNGWNEITGIHQERWLSLADECIRQMKWAQREAKSESHRLITQQRHPDSYFVNVEGIIRSHDVQWSCPLTIAPDDWRAK